MTSEIHHLHLKFAFFLWLFFNGGWTSGESSDIKSFQIWWISETKRLVSTLRWSSPISSTQIRQSEVRCWTWISIRLIKLFWPWKEKRQRFVLMRKKSNNTAFVRNPGVENPRVLNLGIQKLSTKILGCLPPPTFNMIKVNRYDNRGKISRTS